MRSSPRVHSRWRRGQPHLNDEGYILRAPSGKPYPRGVVIETTLTDDEFRLNLSRLFRVIQRALEDEVLE